MARGEIDLSKTLLRPLSDWPAYFTTNRLRDLTSARPGGQGDETALSKAVKYESHPLDICSDSCRARKLREFCEDVEWQEIADLTQKTEQSQQKLACIYHTAVRGDGRIHITRPIHENPLTPRELLKATQNPTCTTSKEEKFIEGSRRLIYVRDLQTNPAFAYGLLLPASTSSQFEALEGALWRHLEHEASFRVYFLPGLKVFRRFRLEFDAPCFKIDYVSPTRQLRKDETDLSFVSINPPDKLNLKCVLRSGHVCCGVDGIDNEHYMAYALVSGIDDYPFEENEQDQQDGENSRGSDTEKHHVDVAAVDDDIEEEPIYMDHLFGAKLQAEFTPSDAREYFLRLVAYRIEQVRGHWGLLMMDLKAWIGKYLQEHPSPMKSRENVGILEAKSLWDWTLQVLDLLTILEDSLDSTIEPWRDFERDGQEVFFDSDIMKVHLDQIRCEYKRLERTLRRVQALKERCERYSSNLKLNLTIRRSETLERGDSVSTLTLFVLSPVIVAAGIFSMQPTAIPFTPSPGSFVAVLVGVSIFMLVLARLVANIKPHAVQKFLLSLVTASDQLDKPQSVKETLNVSDEEVEEAIKAAQAGGHVHALRELARTKLRSRRVLQEDGACDAV